MKVEKYSRKKREEETRKKRRKKSGIFAFGVSFQLQTNGLCVPNCLLRVETHQQLSAPPAPPPTLGVHLWIFLPQQKDFFQTYGVTHNYINTKLSKQHRCRSYCLNIIRKGKVERDLIDELGQIYLGFNAYGLPDNHQSEYIHLQYLYIYICIYLSVSILKFSSVA